MLKYGILGLLRYGSMSGYEIDHIFKQSLNYFWNAQTSQIYRELSTLEKNGWIRRQTIEQNGRPDKNICTITKEGKAQFEQWLQSPAIDMSIRSATLMKVFFMGQQSNEQKTAYFKTLQDQYRHALENLEHAGQSILRHTDGNEQEARCWQMTLDFGRQYMQLYIRWSQQCIEQLQKEENQ